MRPMPIEFASDSSVLVRFGETVPSTTFQEVTSLFRTISALGDARVRNFHPAYATLLIDFDPLQISHHEVSTIVEEALQSGSKKAVAARTIDIPVCYDEEFGPDLSFLSEHCRLPVEEIVRLHHSANYVVHFLGFSPGFGYLGGLPEKLASPRLEVPRKHVAAGSVGIAGMQTGVYPVDSPGGWRLIGRTPLKVFDPRRVPPTLLQPGDAVRFVPIEREQFDELLRAEERL